MELAAILDAARQRLAGMRQERLGELVQPRRLLGIARAPRIVPRLAAWHLGVLLLGDDALYATGEIVRAREEVRRGFTAESQRERDALAGAAFRGGFAEGEVVHIGWTPIDFDVLAQGEASGPVRVVEGMPRVRWSRAGGESDLAAYLDERVELLRHPAPGAT
ncbi:glutaminase [Microbacterium horticulturae]|uniref:Glutaminase n=1 Tax=Microbacterium horticulturae TaxID=3028316 RepID=A0ABY8BYP4_9MICO|nr:glutaminase [Microbacterium sp. KACC 23027]WEG09326.1 glutaminase [Microbacterium sp. KACC 23027]